MACTVSIGGFQRGGVLSGGINYPLKVGGVTAKQQRAVRSSVRVNMAYSQTASAASWASLYQVLSVPADASPRDLKSAYRRMALRYHPDVCPPEEKEECSQMFIKVREAYETLSDPQERQEYDWRVQKNVDLSSGMGMNNNNMNSSWEGRVVELMRRSNSERQSTWGGRMRCRNQHKKDYAASSAR